jgi:hypothetical protein
MPFSSDVPLVDKLSVDICRHYNVNIPHHIVPFKGNPKIKLSVPVLYFIVFFLYTHEMSGMLFSNILQPKTINY